ncbi:MAG: hypothetical protein ACXWDO_10585 [Bacteroidia bacterium]
MEIKLEERKEEFLFLYAEKCPKEADIAREMDIDIQNVKALFRAYKSDVERITLIKVIYNNKKNSVNKITKDSLYHFADQDFKTFYDWYEAQRAEQKGKCYYCGIEEEKLAGIFDFENGIIKNKRGRGRTLELERISTGENENVYSEDNCALACHVCNNNKSDFISATDYKKYFSANVKTYLEAKYLELTARKN